VDTKQKKRASNQIKIFSFGSIEINYLKYMENKIQQEPKLWWWGEESYCGYHKFAVFHNTTLEWIMLIIFGHPLRRTSS
jgi:hypothetical protein